MGKFLGLGEMGTYGLVSAYVAVSIPLIGMRLEYVASRQIVNADEKRTALIIRDQIVFYIINYGALSIAVGFICLVFADKISISFVIYTLLLSILEGIATITSNNIIALHRPILSTVLFFIRSSLWVIPAILLGYFYPEYRNADVIFLLWLAGILLSLIGTIFFFRYLPWKQVLGQSIDWVWIKSSLRITSPIWFGAICMALASNIDRFVVEVFEGREMVGINSFYSSLTVAIPALLGSGVYGFGYPRLIKFHKENDHIQFKKTYRDMFIQAALGAGVLSLFILAIIPFYARAAGRPEFLEHIFVLALLLTGMWIKSVTETIYYIMYARHQDKEIWIGNFIFLIPAALLNFVLVQNFGFIGIGYSSVIAALILSLYRWRCMIIYKPVLVQKI